MYAANDVRLNATRGENSVLETVSPYLISVLDGSTILQLQKAMLTDICVHDRLDTIENRHRRNILDRPTDPNKRPNGADRRVLGSTTSNRFAPEIIVVRRRKS